MSTSNIQNLGDLFYLSEGVAWPYASDKDETVKKFCWSPRVGLEPRFKFEK